MADVTVFPPHGDPIYYYGVQIDPLDDAPFPTAIITGEVGIVTMVVGMPFSVRGTAEELGVECDDCRAAREAAEAAGESADKAKHEHGGLN
jgi:hypothetical protein